MTQDEIIEIARQADIDHHRFWNDDGTNRLETLVKLVAAKEREACAKLCDNASDLGLEYWCDVAEAIRNRGEA